MSNNITWFIVFSNIYALNQCKEFKDTYPKHKNYYETLMVMDDPSTDDYGNDQGDDDDMDLMDLYS